MSCGGMKREEDLEKVHRESAIVDVDEWSSLDEGHLSLLFKLFNGDGRCVFALLLLA